jgi:hypothetical protein
MVYEAIKGVNVSTPLIGGLCCVGFTNPIDVAGVWRQTVNLFGSTE